MSVDERGWMFCRDTAIELEVPANKALKLIEAYEAAKASEQPDEQRYYLLDDLPPERLVEVDLSTRQPVDISNCQHNFQDVHMFQCRECGNLAYPAEPRPIVRESSGCPSCGAQQVWGYCPKSKSGKHYEDIEVPLSGSNDESSKP